MLELGLCGVGVVIIIRTGGVGVEDIVRATVRANPNPWNWGWEELDLGLGLGIV